MTKVSGVTPKLVTTYPRDLIELAETHGVRTLQASEFWVGEKALLGLPDLPWSVFEAKTLEWAYLDRSTRCLRIYRRSQLELLSNQTLLEALADAGATGHACASLPGHLDSGGILLVL